MLIRGGNRITTQTSGGLGFADLDFERPDLSPSRLGYVYVSGVPALPDPAQPYFMSVTAGSGVITVVVACTEDVDGFELSWNTEANVPDVANIMYNSAGQFQVPVAAACYLFARSVRDGRRSVWTAYGEVPPDFSDMQTIWDDDIDAYVDPGGGYVDYPGLVKVSGEYGIYVYPPDTPHYVCTRGTNPNSFNIFSTASGIQLTRFGGRWTVKAVFGKISSADDNQNYGVIYRARAEILTSITGETFYELAIRRYDNDAIYAYLYSYVGTTRTELAKSGDLDGYLTSATDYYELQFDLNGDVFTITKVATGDVLFTATDTTIAATDERIYTGLHFKCAGAATPKLTDNILIEKRIASGNPSEVDPGEYYDGLEADTLETTFNLSENVHWQCGNDDDDYCRVAYDDDQLPVLYRYNAVGNLAATTDLMTGNGTANTVAKFTAVQTVADSNITDDGTTVKINSALVVNEAGAEVDTRVESNTEENMVLVDASEDLLYLGGTTNGVKVSKGGNVTLLGSATQWEDLRIEPVARTTGTNAPTFEKWYDDSGGSSRGVYLYSFDDAAGGSEKEVHFTMQMPHAWAGTAIAVHVHWVGAVADTTAAPRWGMEYIWAEIGAVYGDSVIVYTDGKNYTAVGDDANITAHKHYISKFSAITPSTDQDGISSILIGRLFRNSSAAEDTYNESGAKCGLLYIDAHYEVNSFGSNTEYTK